MNIEVNDIEHYVFSYTGHEHLLEFKIINMNVRMYDPVLGRMLSPDNYVQDPNNPQNYNRYAYCPNNPLVYTDPDGEWIHLVVGAVIGALSAGIGAGVNAAGGGFIARFTSTTTISSTGFIAGAATGTAAGVTNGLMTGTGYGMLGGQNFGNAFVQGGLDQAWKQGLIGGVAGGVFGGIHAANNNRSFWTGAQKTYKIPDAPLLASTNDGIAVDQDGFTVQNNSGETIYYKPETSDPLRGIKGDGAYAIKNSRGIKHAVDGVTAPGKSAQVFKITDPFSTSSIRVNYSSVSIDNPYIFGELTLNKFVGGGWLTTPLDAGWNQIFKMAGYVFK